MNQCPGHMIMCDEDGIPSCVICGWEVPDLPRGVMSEAEAEELHATIRWMNSLCCGGPMNELRMNRTASRRLVARWRLARGYCPECNSSPPLPTCPVCDGSHDYGPNISPERHELLRARWMRAIEEKA